MFGFVSFYSRVIQIVSSMNVLCLILEMYYCDTRNVLFELLLCIISKLYAITFYILDEIKRGFINICVLYIPIFSEDFH